jgi:hypothetical protein
MPEFTTDITEPITSDKGDCYQFRWQHRQLGTTPDGPYQSRWELTDDGGERVEWGTAITDDLEKEFNAVRDTLSGAFVIGNVLLPGV